MRVQKGQTWLPATIRNAREEPRSYQLTDGRRRSSIHIRPQMESNPQSDSETAEDKDGSTEDVTEAPEEKPSKENDRSEQTPHLVNNDGLRRSERVKNPIDRYGKTAPMKQFFRRPRKE